MSLSAAASPAAARESTYDGVRGMPGELPESRRDSMWRPSARTARVAAESSSSEV